MDTGGWVDARQLQNMAQLFCEEFWNLRLDNFQANRSASGPSGSAGEAYLLYANTKEAKKTYIFLAWLARAAMQRGDGPGEWKERFAVAVSTPV